MSTKDAVKEFRDYFTEFEWTDHAVRKVETIIKQVAEANNKPVEKIKIKYVHTKGRQGYTTAGIPQPVVDFDAIAEKVCQAHNLPADAIYSKKRNEEYVHARADFVYRVKNINPYQSLKSIGRYMRRDHTTIIHLINGIRYGHYKIGVGE